MASCLMLPWLMFNFLILKIFPSDVTDPKEYCSNLYSTAIDYYFAARQYLFKLYYFLADAFYFIS